MEEKMKSKKKSFFWNYEDHWFTKRFCTVLLFTGIAILISAIVTNYFYNKDFLYITIPLMVFANLLMLAFLVRILWDYNQEPSKIGPSPSKEETKENINTAPATHNFFWNKETRWFSLPIRVIFYLLSMGFYTASFFMLNFIVTDDFYFFDFWVFLGLGIILEIMAIFTNNVWTFSFKGLWVRAFATLIITLAIFLLVFFLY